MLLPGSFYINLLSPQNCKAARTLESIWAPPSFAIILGSLDIGAGAIVLRDKFAYTREQVAVNH